MPTPIVDETISPPADADALEPEHPTIADAEMLEPPGPTIADASPIAEALEPEGPTIADADMLEPPEPPATIAVSIFAPLLFQLHDFAGLRC